MALVSRLRLITDSVADLPPDLAKLLHVAVVPVYVSFGQQQQLDNGTLNRDQFYQALARAPEPPMTAAPPPHEFLRAYEALEREGAEDIVGLFAAASVSSIYAHAQIAAQKVQHSRVHIIDTRQVSMGIGWIVITVAEAVAQGIDLRDLMALVERIRPRVRVFGVLDSVEHLRHSGRVSWVTARFADLLQIKPLIAFESGEAKLIGRVRTYRRALERMVELVRALAPLERLAIIHSRAAQPWIDQLMQALLPLSPESSIPVIEVGPVFASHIGPRCLGVALVHSE